MAAIVCSGFSVRSPQEHQTDTKRDKAKPVGGNMGNLQTKKMQIRSTCYGDDFRSQ